MTNPDSFIDEVTEELRRDRLFALMRRYGWIAILLILLIVGGAAWNEWRKASERAEAQAFGDAMLAALEQDDPAARAAALADIGAEQSGQTAVLGLMVAAQHERAGDREAATEALSRVADDGDVIATYRQLARLKRVMLAGESMPVEERRAELEALAGPGAPFAPLALEQLALLQVAQGETEAAVASLRELLSGSEVTPGLRRRATQLMVSLGAEPDAQG